MNTIEKLYCVQDELSGNLHHFILATSDGLAVRNILLTLQVPLKDNQVYCLGTFEKVFDTEQSRIDMTDCKFCFLDKPRKVSWSSYKFPNDIAEALAPLGLSTDEIREISQNKIKQSDSSLHSSNVRDVNVTEIYRNGGTLNG